MRCWLLLPLAALCLLTGCGRTVELKDRLIVQAVGVDWQEDAFLLTVQVFESGGGEREAADPGGAVYQAGGRTMTEALRGVETRAGKTVYLGSNQLLLLGEELAAEKRAGEAVSFFNSNHQTRPKLQVAVAEGKAADLVGLETEQGLIQAETLQRSIQLSIEDGACLPGTLMDVVRAFQAAGTAAGTPLLRKTQDAAGQPSFELAGTALLRDGETIGTLDQRETLGAAWLLRGIKQRELVLEDGEARYTAVLRPQAVGVRCEIEKERPVFHLELKARCSIPEVVQGVRTGTTTKDAERLAALAEEAIRQEVTAALQACLQEYQADPFDFQQYLERDQVRWWQQHAGQWPDLLADCKVTLSVSVRVHNLGLGIGSGQ